VRFVIAFGFGFEGFERNRRVGPRSDDLPWHPIGPTDAPFLLDAVDSRRVHVVQFERRAREVVGEILLGTRFRDGENALLLKPRETDLRRPSVASASSNAVKG
jgi:hypothetical protein